MIRIVSGGQTGVDRAALDAAVSRGAPVGGWCPLGRLAEDGVIPPSYPLRETPTAAYPERTRWNVRDSDATLVLACGEPAGGTALTVETADRLGRPFLVLDLLDRRNTAVTLALLWARELNIGILNVAGPRESASPGAYGLARAFMESFLDGLKKGAEPAPPGRAGPAPRFMVDRMLVRLGKYLRVMGYDAEWDAGAATGELVDRANRENRIFLTRNRRLADQHGIPDSAVLFETGNPVEQVAQLLQKMRLDPGARLFSRCIRCNVALRNIADKTLIRDRVHPAVYLRHSTFYTCPSCGTVFWKGSHVANTLRKLSPALDRA
ncbi:MAG: hypothetical protein FJ224_02460 [Lentisphaerae bacterium]|nr:hypothetical protein [Lentisphaerota bacterium]